MSSSSDSTAKFLADSGATVPVICGAMYPCSNPELIAAVSAAGGLGIIQPVAMVYAHRRDLRDGIREIRQQTDNPIGFNMLIEKTTRLFEDQMKRWFDTAIEEGVGFFVTAMGNPRWIVERAHAAGAVVYHNTTERKWGLKALDAGVDGLIAVNNRAGGHARASETPRVLLEELASLNVPVVLAGGVSTPEGLIEALDMGYAGVQMGTRFIATTECTAHDDYKQAIVRAHAKDIVLTDKISGVPVAVINTPFVEKVGTKAGRIGRRLLRSNRTKYWMRTFYGVRSMWQLKRASLKGLSYNDYFQAGRSVEGIDEVESAEAIVKRLGAAAEAWKGGSGS